MSLSWLVPSAPTNADRKKRFGPVVKGATAGTDLPTWPMRESWIMIGFLQDSDSLDIDNRHSSLFVQDILHNRWLQIYQWFFLFILQPQSKTGLLPDLCFCGSSARFWCHRCHDATASDGCHLKGAPLRRHTAASAETEGPGRTAGRDGQGRILHPPEKPCGHLAEGWFERRDLWILLMRENTLQGCPKRQKCDSRMWKNPIFPAISRSLILFFEG